MKFTFFDFYSGIGAGHIALKRIGGQCMGFVEIDKLNESTYREINQVTEEELKNWGDIDQITIKDLPKFDLMIAGFPCQSFSNVGNGKGFDDKRGQAIYKITEILKEKPKCFLLENVKGLLYHDKQQTFNKILRMLTKKGYRVFWKVLKSSDFGIPQMRERVYLVGFNQKLIKKNFKFNFPVPSGKKADMKKFLASNDKQFVLNEKQRNWSTFLKNIKKQKLSLKKIVKKDYSILDTRQSVWKIFENRCPTLRATRHGMLYFKNGMTRQFSGTEALMLQGFRPNEIKRIKTASNTKILFQAGNAFTVNVIEAIGNEIKNQFLSKLI